MIYRNTAAQNNGQGKPFAPYDPEANAAFDEAKSRWSRALFDLWNAPDKAEFDRITGALEAECNEAAQKAPTRLKPLACLPALLAQYLSQEVFG